MGQPDADNLDEHGNAVVGQRGRTDGIGTTKCSAQWEGEAIKLCLAGSNSRVGDRSQAHLFLSEERHRT